MLQNKTKKKPQPNEEKKKQKQHKHKITTVQESENTLQMWLQMWLVYTFLRHSNNFNMSDFSLLEINEN